MSVTILKRPLVSEKAQKLAEKANTYCFAVDRGANKIEIRKAVEAMYGVAVVDVNTAIMPGKVRTRHSKTRVMKGMKPAYKKAIVKLAEGETIDIFTSNEE